MKKIALKAIRESIILSNNEKYHILINNPDLIFRGTNEQFTLLMKSIYTDLSIVEQDELIGKVLNLGTERNLELYNFAKWIEMNDPGKQIIYDFLGGKVDDDFVINEIETIIPSPGKNRAQYSQFMQNDVVEEIMSINSENEIVPKQHQNSFLILFSEMAGDDYDWTFKASESFISEKMFRQDIWEALLSGIYDSDFSIHEFSSLIDLFYSHLNDIPDHFGFSLLIERFLQFEKVKNNFLLYREKLLEMFAKLISIQENKVYKEEDVNYLASYNTTIGISLLCLLKMLTYELTNDVPMAYQKLFNSFLGKNDWERCTVVLILAGHFDFLYERDKNWCQEKIISYMNGKDKQLFLYAWRGISHFCNLSDRKNAIIWKRICKEAVKNINLLDTDTKHCFLLKFLFIVNNYINHPENNWIPIFYNSASDEDINIFVYEIEQQITNMDEEHINKMWKKWFKNYLQNRIDNKPIPLNEDEMTSFLLLLPEMNIVYDETVQILSKGKIPRKFMDLLFWAKLDENNLQIKHPESTALIVEMILNASDESVYLSHYLEKVVKDLLHLLQKEERDQLLEAMLRRCPGFVE